MNLKYKQKKWKVFINKYRLLNSERMHYCLNLKHFLNERSKQNR